MVKQLSLPIKAGMMLKMILTCILLFPVSTPAISLNQAIEIALRHSDQMEIISNSHQASETEARNITSFSRPQLNASASWFELDSNGKTSPFVPRYDRQFKIEGSASQLLFAGGRIWQSRTLANNLFRLADKRALSEKSRLIYKVAMQYTEVQWMQALVEIFHDRVQQGQQEIEDAESLFQAGLVPLIDVRESQLRLQQVANNLRNSEFGLEAATINFNLALGKTPDQVPETPDSPLTEIGNLDRLLHNFQQLMANKEQLQLQLLTDQQTAADKKLQMINGERWPTLAAVAGGESSGEKTDSMDENWYYGIQLDWPLFSGGDIHLRKLKSQADMRQIQALYRQSRKELFAQLAILRKNGESLQQQIHHQRQAVELAQANYQDARTLYTEGTITLTRLGQFNLSYAETRYGLAQLLYNQNRLANELRWLTTEAKVGKGHSTKTKN